MRRVKALIDGLPPDAMVWRREPGWGIREELAALDVEVGHAALRVLLRAFSKSGASVPKQLRIPRPYEDRRRRPRRRVADPGQYGGSVRRIGAAATNGAGD
jgi:hypothetical protein